MEIKGRSIAILGGAGLVGMAIARALLRRGPKKLVIAALREDEALQGVAELEDAARAVDCELVAEWGDLFVRDSHRVTPRAALLAEEQTRREVLEDTFGLLGPDLVDRSALVSLLERHRPGAVVDCVNTATAIAYQDMYATAQGVRERAAAGEASVADVETLQATLYLPQLIRHVQLLL